MENRQTVTYQRVIDVLKALPALAQWDVKNVSLGMKREESLFKKIVCNLDFEQGARRAWLNSFPSVKINYCFFHYEQSIRTYVLVLYVVFKN